IEDQKRIVELFATWDTAILKTEQLIAAKEQHYLHELSRLIRLNQHRKGGVGNTSDSASVRKRAATPAVLGDFLTESREPDIGQDVSARLTVRLHLQGVDARPVRGTESDGATLYFRRRAGQLIYGKQNIFRGAIGLIPSELDGYSSTQDLPAFDIRDGVDPKWLYYWLSRKEFYESLESRAAGSGSKRLHPEEFFKVKIVLPDLAVQVATARYLDSLREEIDILGRVVAATKTQKRGLMQKLLTGKLRLPAQEEAG
ncbi:MAG: restriction endonuclease subunit S, partial [Moraxellaceae bacterium]|nr:restriction endonuclease subunit S [Moraxellaceae bacterium]